MAKEDQRKNKLIHLMKDLLLTEATKENHVPASLSDYVLGEYGLKRSSDVIDLPEEEGSDFVYNLENFIKEKYEALKIKQDNNPQEENQKYCFMKSCDAFAAAKSEYLQITINMNSLLNELIQLKEKYSKHLVGKSHVKKEELEVLEKKLHCLKLQSFVKFYSENSALDAHLQLKEILAERLKILQSQYNNLVDLVAKYNELKNNKSYIELLQLYKQLLEKEMKIDYMVED